VSSFDDILAEALEETPAPPEETLAAIRHLGETLRNKDNLIERLELALKQAKEERAEISRKSLPDLLLGAGFREFTLEDGTGFELVEGVSAGIPKDMKDAALDWINASGNGGLIKTKVVAAFAKGDEARAREEAERLKAVADTVTLDRDVHYQTLQKFVKELLAAGVDVPADLFGIFHYREVLPKKNGKRSKKS
jgi:hypothetical protein